MNGNHLRYAAGEDAGHGPAPPNGPPPAPDLPNGPTLSRVVVIANPQGLHMRPAAAFAKCAQQFQSRVTVRLGERTVDGKSIFDVLLLAAEPGAELVLEASGSDAAAALATLGDILALPSMDDEPPAEPTGQ
jgi:phosphotransferase system HPr (HPr) family protein